MKTLLATATTTAACFVESRNAFKRTYATAKFYLEGPLVEKDDSGSIIEASKQIVHIRNTDIVSSALQLFGDMIYFVELTFTDIDATNAATISATVMENCANTLIELQLKGCFGTILDSFQKPFPNVNVTAFTTHTSTPLQIGTNTWTLSRLFPNAKQLSVTVANTDYWTVIGDSFPQLKVLSVAHPKPTYASAVDIGKLLNNSRSISSLAVSYSSMAMLETASNALPELNVLQLSEFADDFYTGTDITFQNVSNLRIVTSTNNAQVPEKLHFVGVKALTLSLGYNFTEQWHQFVRSTSQSVEWLNLKTLAVDADELKTIAHDSSHVKLATISSDKKMPTTEIVNFLEHSPQLEWLVVESALIGTAQRNVLEGRLEQSWLIEYLELTEQFNRIRFTRYCPVISAKFRLIYFFK